MSKVKRWAKLLPWKPSSQQVIQYMRAKGYKVPLHRKTRRPTSNDEALKKLLVALDKAGKPPDPVIPGVLTSRAIVKGIGYLKDTYVGKDERFHSQFTFHPRTGRLSCVPLTTQILTAEGWKTWDQLQPGERVAGYSLTRHCLEWTTLRKIHRGRGTLGELRLRYSRKQARGTRVRCTPEHQWVVRSGQGNPVVGMVESQRIPQRWSPLLAAPGLTAKEGERSALTPPEAALLGWAITDGHIKEVSAGHYRLQVILRKPRSIAAFREVATHFKHTETVSEQFGVTRFYFGVDVFTPIYPKRLEKECLHLSRAAQEAMWAAMVEADGSYRERKKSRETEIRFGAQKQRTIDVFTALAASLGKVVTFTQRKAKGRYLRGYTPQFSDFHVRLSPFGGNGFFPGTADAEVWCPETDLGTWVMRGDGVVAITGNSRAPNLMQVPSGRGSDIEGRIAASIRKTIKAPPGYYILEIDYKAQEALLLGYFANDPVYMRMARLGVYSFVLAPSLGIHMDLGDSDESLASTCAHIKETYKNAYADLKQTCLALGYGEMVPTISKRLGITLKEAYAYADLYDQVAPSIKRFQKEIRLKAHKEKCLVNPWGYSQTFYHVFKRSKSDPNQWLLGDEANEVLAFLPQSSGAFILRRALRDLWGIGVLSEGRFIPVIPVHDAVVSFVQKTRLGHFAGLAKTAMEAPIPQLGGLTISVEMKYGENWGDMRKL